MGIFDKIKSVANMVTGGGAKVSVEVENPSLKAPFKVNIRATIAGADLKISKVYLWVKSVEKVTARNVEVAKSGGGTEKQDVQSEEDICQKMEFVVDGAQTLAAKQDYQWSKEIQLPLNATASYYGKNAKHEWLFYAGIDVTGNDPDSGWISVDIQQ